MVKIMENPFERWDDLGVPLFLETPICVFVYVLIIIDICIDLIIYLSIFLD